MKAKGKAKMVCSNLIISRMILNFFSMTINHRAPVYYAVTNQILLKMGRIFLQCLDFYRNFTIFNLQFAFYNSGLSGLGIGR